MVFAAYLVKYGYDRDSAARMLLDRFPAQRYADLRTQALDSAMWLYGPDPEPTHDEKRQ